MRRLIYHVDVNSAFLSWESVRRLSRGESDLRTVPSAISGDPQKRHGVILAKSGPAKAYGIKTGEPLVSALQKCPQLVLAPPDHALYERMSAAFVAVLREFAPVVEQVSVDECYLDMSGMERIYPDELQAAYLIRDAVRDRLGFTVNVGVARNKLLAKMASDFEKPDRVHTLFDEEIPQKLWPLPVGELFSVGRATADKLQRQGIKTIGTLASLDPSLLIAMVGEKQGAMLHAFANGRDDSAVRSEGEAAKGYSNSVTLSENITTLDAAHGVLLSLIDNAASRMRADGARAYCIGVSIRTDQFKNFSHQRKLKEPTDITAEILEIAEQLLREFWDRRMPLRLIGVSLTMITHEKAEQVSLFPDERRERRRKIDYAVDSIRGRFGRGTIHRAAQLSEESEPGGADEPDRTP
ncbi:MAG: DNA polymerase IV [Clostridia bacterium]|nr:DNA polymerase IV [Clostridia bacterium]